MKLAFQRVPYRVCMCHKRACCMFYTFRANKAHIIKITYSWRSNKCGAINWLHVEVHIIRQFETFSPGIGILNGTFLEYFFIYWLLRSILWISFSLNPHFFHMPRDRHFFFFFQRHLLRLIMQHYTIREKEKFHLWMGVTKCAFTKRNFRDDIKKYIRWVINIFITVQNSKAMTKRFFTLSILFQWFS